MRTVYEVIKATETTDNDRTIETVADEVKQEIINKYYQLNSLQSPNQNHDRITITAGVVVED
jgi:hypothetical protein